MEIPNAINEKELLELFPARFTIGHLTPAYLAPIYKLYLNAPGIFVELWSKLSNLLLDLTIHQAYSQSEFYRNLYGHLSEDKFIGYEELENLPTVTRQQVERAFETVCLKYSDFAFSSYTSGTSNFIPLIINRSSQEQNYLYSFFSLLANNEKEDAVDPQLVLSLAGNYHGQVLQIPGSAYNFPLDIFDEKRLHQALELLSRPYKINGNAHYISVIAGLSSNITSLTAFLKTVGDHHDIIQRIKLIQTSGQYLTRYNAKWLSEFWECPVLDVFSLAEVFFRAAQCQHCQLYHFDPFGVAEVIEIDSEKRITHGRGRLVVTGLFPFTQMTPFIRYLTGDVVEVKATNCISGSLGYKLLGRIHNSLPLQDTKQMKFLSSAEVYEILDELPDISRPVRHEHLPSSCSSFGTMPYFSLEREGEINYIKIQLQYSPTAFPARIKELENIIKHNLINQHPELDVVLNKNQLIIKFYPPNTFTQKPKLRP